MRLKSFPSCNAFEYLERESGYFSANRSESVNTCNSAIELCHQAASYGFNALERFNAVSIIGKRCCLIKFLVAIKAS